MVDRVRLRKMESPSSGGSQTDDMPTGINPNEDYADVRGVSIQDPLSNDETTLIDRLNLDMRFKDGNNPVPKTLTQLLAGTGGLTEGSHENLDTLAHNISETSFVEVVRTGGRVSSVIVWTNSGKTIKIRETSITRTGGLVSQVIDKQYDATGLIIAGQTDTQTITRIGSRVASISSVVS